MGCEEQIFNNTISGNRRPNILVGNDKETYDNAVRNNILTGNRGPNRSNAKKTTICDHNLLAVNALFRDSKADDFYR